MSEIVTGIVDGSEAQLAEFDLAKRVGDKLTATYPNYLWQVTCREGVVFVNNVNLSGRWGFVLKDKDLYGTSATDFDKRVMRAGGELLERYRVSRTKMNNDRVQSKLLALPTDFAGRLVFDK